MFYLNTAAVDIILQSQVSVLTLSPLQVWLLWWGSLVWSRGTWSTATLPPGWVRLVTGEQGGVTAPAPPPPCRPAQVMVTTLVLATWCPMVGQWSMVWWWDTVLARSSLHHCRHPEELTLPLLLLPLHHGELLPLLLSHLIMLLVSKISNLNCQYYL